MTQESKNNRNPPQIPWNCVCKTCISSLELHLRESVAPFLQSSICVEMLMNVARKKNNIVYVKPPQIDNYFQSYFWIWKLVSFCFVFFLSSIHWYLRSRRNTFYASFLFLNFFVNYYQNFDRRLVWRVFFGCSQRERAVVNSEKWKF